MRLTARQLNRATLERQLLLGRASLPVVDAVHRVVALQAQAPPSPYIALWDRVADFDPAELDRAFADQARREGLAHADRDARGRRRRLSGVPRGDENSLRGARLNDARFKVAGLSSAEADALIPDGRRLRGRTTDDRRGRGVAERATRHHRRGAASGGRCGCTVPSCTPPRAAHGRSASGRSYVAARVQAASRRRGRVDAAARLSLPGGIRAGPLATSPRSPWSTCRGPIEAVRSQAERLERFEGPDGSELFDVPGGALPADDTPAPPRLMAMWDSALLAYVDRSRIIPPDYRRIVTRSNGDVLPTCSWTATWRGSGDPSRVASRRRRSTVSPTTRGTAWKRRRERSMRSSPSANGTSTAAMPIGGRACRAPRSASSAEPSANDSAPALERRRDRKRWATPSGFDPVDAARSISSRACRWRWTPARRPGPSGRRRRSAWRPRSC